MKRFIPFAFIPFAVTSYTSIDNDEQEQRDENTHEVVTKGAESYIEKYGMHFTDKLAEKAISIMESTAAGSNEKWSVSDVAGAMSSLNMKVPDGYTIADIAYAANMYKMDFYPKVIKQKSDCIEAAILIATDKDGYGGIIFNRWLADMKAKKVNINWTNYL